MCNVTMSLILLILWALLLPGVGFYRQLLLPNDSKIFSGLCLWLQENMSVKQVNTQIVVVLWTKGWEGTAKCSTNRPDPTAEMLWTTETALAPLSISFYWLPFTWLPKFDTPIIIPKFFLTQKYQLLFFDSEYQLCIFSLILENILTRISLNEKKETLYNCVHIIN